MLCKLRTYHQPGNKFVTSHILKGVPSHDTRIMRKDIYVVRQRVKILPQHAFSVTGFDVTVTVTVTVQHLTIPTQCQCHITPLQNLNHGEACTHFDLVQDCTAYVSCKILDTQCKWHTTVPTDVKWCDIHYRQQGPAVHDIETSYGNIAFLSVLMWRCEISVRQVIGEEISQGVTRVL